MSGCHVRLRSGFRGTWPWCSSSTWTGLLLSSEVVEGNGWLRVQVGGGGVSDRMNLLLI